jgi:hypothetical protein
VAVAVVVKRLKLLGQEHPHFLNAIFRLILPQAEMVDKSPGQSVVEAIELVPRVAQDKIGRNLLEHHPQILLRVGELFPVRVFV